MGQISMEIIRLPGSVLSGNQQSTIDGGHYPPLSPRGRAVRPDAYRSPPSRKRSVVMTAPATLAIYAGAALAEILGCFAVRAWMRQGASPLRLLPGLVSLAVFAWLLTLAPSDFAGRAYAAYGGVYIAVALGWLWAVDGIAPTRWDLVGAGIALAGMAIIVLAPRAAA